MTSRIHQSEWASLVLVIVLAVLLTAAVARGAFAVPLFQSSFVSPTEPALAGPRTNTPAATPGPVATSTATRPIGAGTVSAPTQAATPIATQAAPAAPTVAPASAAPPPSPVPTPPSPAGSGFLPAPTLTNPDNPAAGRETMLQPQGQPLMGPAVAAPETDETPAPTPAPGPADLIDSAAIAVSYIWLCCGGVLLVGAVLALAWLARRSARRR